MAPRSSKSPNAFRTISEVADGMGIPQHVLRFWESKFSQIKPMKRGGGRRYYRPEDVEVIEAIRSLLHRDGYTIKGAQKLIREQGVKSVVEHHVHGEGPMEVSGSLEEDAVAVESKPQGADGLKLMTIRNQLENIRKKLKA